MLWLISLNILLIINRAINSLRGGDMLCLKVGHFIINMFMLE